MRKYILLSTVALIGLGIAAAVADYTIRDAQTNAIRTLKAFVCETTKQCNASVPVNSSGTEIGSQASPLYIDTPAAGNLFGAVSGDLPKGVYPPAVTMQNAAVATGNGVSLDVQGYAVAVLNVTSSIAMSGGTTITFEASVDDTTWVSVLAHAVGTTTAPSTTTIAAGDFRISVAGYKSLRARISAFGAGQITILGRRNVISGPVHSIAATQAGPWNVGNSPAAAATGGATTTSIVAAGSTNATNLKATPGTVYGVQLSGIGSVPAWLKFFDTAGTPACTETVVAQFMIPANSTAALGGGNNAAFIVGKAFTTGIGYCVVNGIAAGDTASVAAANYVINIDWK